MNTNQDFDCQTCGQRTNPQEFHSYDSCLLYKAAQNTLTRDERIQIFQIGLNTVAERAEKQEVPA